MYKGLFLLILCEMCVLYTRVLADKQDSIKWAIDTFVKEGLACHPGNPGLSLAVVHGDDVLLSKGYGFKTVDKKEPVTNKTLFSIASLSKAFASTLILKLVEENKGIRLSTKVKDILNNDNIFRDSLRSKYTTLEDLLAHRLGFPSNNNIRLDDTLTRNNLVERLQYLKAVGGFRTSFYYSNLMYGLLTHISEVIGQKSFEELVREKIYEPLSMTSSNFATTADRSKLDIAQGYQDDDGKLFPVPTEFSRHWGLLCGSGCILSNSNDMVQWIKFHLNQGKNQDGVSVVDYDVLEDAYANQNSVHTSFSEEYYTRPITPVTWSLDNYGLAWKLGYYRGYKVITHTGSTYGYRALLTLVPALKIGVFTTLTGDDPNYMFRTNIQSYIIDVISGNQPWLNSTSVCTFPEPWKEKKTKSRSDIDRNLPSSRELKFYTGIYKQPAYGSSEVYINTTTGLLMAKIGFGQFILYPKTTPNEFYAEGFGFVAKSKKFSRFQFKFTDDGDYAASLVVPSFNSRDPPVFKRAGNMTASRNVRSTSSILQTSWLLALVVGVTSVVLSEF